MDGADIIMKVCMLVSNAPPLFSGASKQAFLLTKTLKSISENVEIKIVSIDQKKISTDNNRIKRIVKKNKFIYSIKVINYFLKNKFDIIHIHGIYYWQIIIILYFFYRKKIIFKITMKGHDDLHTIANLFLGKIRISLLKNVKALIALTDEFVSSDFKNIHIIPNGVDIEKFNSVPLDEKNRFKKKLFSICDIPCIVYSGVICERKNQLDLLKNLSFLLQENKICLVLCGSYDNNFGEYDKLYVSKVVNYARGLKNVHLTGQINNVNEYYNACEYIISNSKSEGLSNSILEGLCSGLFPIILNHEIQKLPKIINQVSLNIESSCSSREVCQNIEQFISNKNKYVDVQSVQKYFSIEKTANKILNLYRM